MVKPCRMLVAPLVPALSKTMQFFGTDPLDADERAMTTFSLSALAYQYGGKVDARVMCLATAIGIASPRIIKALMEGEKKKTEQAASASAATVKEPPAIPPAPTQEKSNG